MCPVSTGWSARWPGPSPPSFPPPVPLFFRASSGRLCWEPGARALGRPAASQAAAPPRAWQVRARLPVGVARTRPLLPSLARPAAAPGSSFSPLFNSPSPFLLFFPLPFHPSAIVVSSTTTSFFFFPFSPPLARFLFCPVTLLIHSTTKATRSFFYGASSILSARTRSPFAAIFPTKQRIITHLLIHALDQDDIHYHTVFLSTHR